MVNPSKNFNIFIINAHWHNRGDEAALRAMIDSLRSRLTINRMQIMFSTKMPTSFPYNDIDLIEPTPSLNGRFSFFLWIIDAFYIIISFGNFSLTENGRKFISSVKDADIVIHAPGGASIGDLYIGKMGINEIFYLYRLLISILQNKPIFYYAPSMGPFNGFLRNVLRKFILDKAKIIVVREELSKNYLRDQLDLEAFASLDSAFQNEIEPNYLNRYGNINEILNLIQNEKVVGITPTDLKWHSLYGSNVELRERILNSLNKAIYYLINKGYYILLIPQIFDLENKELEQELLDNLRSINKDKIFIVPENIDSYGQQLLITKLFFTIGMRYHSNIFAAKGKVPSIMICYEHKMKGFAEKLGRDDLVLNVKDISAEKIIAKVEYIESDYMKIKKELERIMPVLIADSRKTTEIFLKYYII